MGVLYESNQYAKEGKLVHCGCVATQKPEGWATTIVGLDGKKTVEIKSEKALTTEELKKLIETYFPEKERANG